MWEFKVGITLALGNVAIIQITPTLLNLWLGDLGVGRAQVCRATDFHRI